MTKFNTHSSVILNYIYLTLHFIDYSVQRGGIGKEVLIGRGNRIPIFIYAIQNHNLCFVERKFQFSNKISSLLHKFFLKILYLHCKKDFVRQNMSLNLYGSMKMIVRAGLAYSYGETGYIANTPDNVVPK